MARAGRKKIDRSGIDIQNYLTSSGDPEEILFKLNEILYGQNNDVLRKNPRIPVNFPLSWKAKDRDRPGSSYTLSREGMYIKTPRPPKPYTEVEIRFKLPGFEYEVYARGEVVRKVSMAEAKGKGLVSGMAVVFKDIHPEHQRIIDQFIEERMKKIF
jgi:hypothetical protein